MDGKALAQKMLDQCAAKVERIKQQLGVTPGLATVLVGDDPASAIYVRMKARRSESVGLQSIRIELPAQTTTRELVDQIGELGRDPNVHGILLQHPVGAHIDERAGFEAIPPAKDVDGMSYRSFAATAFDTPALGACTPAGIMQLLAEYSVDPKGQHAVVIGRSVIVGKPMAMMLLARHATVTMCHSRTKDLPGICRQAEILVAAVGRPQFVRGDWIKPGAVVIDAGYNEGNVGDVDFAAASANASMITPVTGGVGPMTVAMLLVNTLAAVRISIQGR